MRMLLEVIKHDNGLVEFRVNDRHVKFLDRGTTFAQARSAAYEYVWARPTYMWTIKGAVA